MMKRNMETYHKQVRVRANGQDAYVDEGIAPLIREMWRAGIRTQMSCQEDGFGLVWLNFDCPLEAAKFMNIVAEYEEEPNSLYQRMLGHYAEVADTWEYDVLPEDFNLIEEPDKSTGSLLDCTFRDFPTFGHDGSSLGVMLLARG